MRTERTDRLTDGSKFKGPKCWSNNDGKYENFGRTDQGGGIGYGTYGYYPAFLL